MQPTAYQISSENIIWELIGKQVVIADLSTGKYLCLNNESGVLIWKLLVTGKSDSSILNTLAKQYDPLSKVDIQKSLLFISKLSELGIISAAAQPISANSEALEIDYSLLSQDFKEPNLLLYDDLDTLLLIDPIDDDIEQLMQEEARNA